MNKNRQQLKTGLRAILGGGLREEPAPSDNVESEAAPASEPEPINPVIAPVETRVILEKPAPEPPEHIVVLVKTPGEDPPEEDRPTAASHEEPARKQRKKPAPPPPARPEPTPKMAPSVRVGTLENPYVRKRDNLPTRKVGIVLPVALAERMQIHCVKARTRPNEFVARAIEALLDELQA